MRRIVAFLAQQMPVGSPAACLGLSFLFFLTASVLLPAVTRLARGSPVVSEALDGCDHGWAALRLFQWTATVGAYLGIGVFQARCLHLCFPEYFARDYEKSFAGGRGCRPFAGGIRLAGMRIRDEDLRASILVTGATGSAKTAGILMPAMAQLLGRYNREEGAAGGGRFAKLGAFIPEVKGDLVEGCVYLAHEAGRCVSRDVRILTPSSRIPAVRYRDESGRRWFLCARGGSGGSEAGLFLPAASFPAGHPRAGRRLTDSALQDETEAGLALSALAGRPIPLGRRRPGFIGWRWTGGRLLRVSHTARRNEAAPLLGADGRRQWCEAPRTLEVEGFEYVDNGMHYNLIDARLPAPEAAERLTRLAAMARGGGEHGENDYFYEQSRKLMAACIALHRAVESVPCSARDVVRLATREAHLAAALAALGEKVDRLRRAGGEETARALLPLEELAAYFQDEWRRMVADGKTANVIKSILSAAFDPFLRDPDLAETFGRTSSFSFEDIAEEGRIIALLPGDRYEHLGRLLGTACKMDFQSTMLSRSGRSDLNSARLVVYFADECHKYIISGSSTAGDPYFMNLSRSNNVANLCATQSYAWITEVIGREAANVYLSAFGSQFWLQQTDPETCRRAAEICGSATREKVRTERSFEYAGLGRIAGGGGHAVVRQHRAEEERERHRPEEFAQLDVGEVISYNKGRPGRSGKVVKGRVRYHFCTRRPQGVRAVHARMREYYRELLENLTYERGEAARWNS